MFNKSTLLSLAAGLVVAGVVVGLIVLKQQGATPRLAGQITNVRTLGMDQSSSVAIVDFRFTNDSKYRFVVGSTAMSVVDAQGQSHEGRILAAADIRQLFELFPALGLKTGEPLIIKTRIPPGGSSLATLAARFEIPKEALDARKKVTLSVQDVDGPVSEISR